MFAETMLEQMQRLLVIMARLRDPDNGCPWDLEQTFASVAPYTIEEAYEVADAIAREDMPELKDELGDLLFQVVFHAQMAKEAGLFDFNDVARAASDKMVRRHPHVFDEVETGDQESLHHAWEAQKQEERRQKAGDAPLSALDGVSVSLPGLTRAVKLQKRAARVGFDWPEPGPVLDKVREELDEVSAEIDGGDKARLQDEVGDVFFACANLARHLGIDPEAAIREANGKFERRFHHMEGQCREQGQDMADLPLKALEQAWNRAKKA